MSKGTKIPTDFMKLVDDARDKPYIDYDYNKSSKPSQKKRAELRKKRKKRKR